MTGEALLHQFFGEVHTWLVDGAVHYRECPHRGQPHYRPDEPCMWMSREASHAFLAWAVQKGYITPSWAQASLKHEGLQEGSALADAAAAVGDAHSERSGRLVGLIRRYPLPTLLVGFGVGLLLGQRYSLRT
jgi:hypothetical protein